MKVKEAISTYFTGTAIIGCGTVLWALGRADWWLPLLIIGLGLSSIAARLLLKRRRPHA